MSEHPMVFNQTAAQRAPTVDRRVQTSNIVGKIATHLILLVMAVLMIFPLLWLISTSFKEPSKQMIWPPQLIPNPWYPQNYVQLFIVAPMGLYLFNSFKVTTLTVIGTSLSSSLAAFAFARMHFRGKNALFAILLATMMLPYAVTVIPTFTIMRQLGWLDTHYPLFVPAYFGSAFNVFLLRQSYRSIPQDLFDAAKVDGAGFFRIYWQIFIPLGMATLVTVAIFAFLGSWNDLFSPLIYLSTQEKMTVALGLAYLRGRAGTGVGTIGVIMAGSMLVIVPMLLLYGFGQRYFIQGLARSGLKG
ncbi:MAG TPA: carbohydrate ABC transporter permease [Caldilineaceae bacterium]|nr:carbohydrate ABC transporter permease [Caldilineaceae bacterium]